MEDNYNKLWDDYYPKVFGYFYRRVNNRQDVEDLTSVTLAGFFANISRSEVLNQNALIWKIAHNQLVSFIRSKSKNPVSIDLSSDENHTDYKIDDLRSDNYKFKLTALQECIQNQLTGDQKLIVHKSIIEDQKSHDIGLEMNLSAANVRQILSRSISKLKSKCKQLWVN
jgi:RNA polymerase sigma-70 factor, ECF subfamily